MELMKLTAPGLINNSVKAPGRPRANFRTANDGLAQKVVWRKTGSRRVPIRRAALLAHGLLPLLDTLRSFPYDHVRHHFGNRQRLPRGRSFRNNFGDYADTLNENVSIILVLLDRLSFSDDFAGD